MFLKRFEVENYKNFKSKFILDFSDIRDYKFSTNCIGDGMVKDAIIYGKNAVGKTNFGMAMFDITYHLVDKNRNLQSQLCYCNADAVNKRAEFCYSFVDAGREIVYRYQKEQAEQVVYEALWVDNDLVFSFDFETRKGNFDNLSKFGLETLNWEFRDNGISILRYMANNLALDAKHPIMALMRFVNGMLWFCSLGNGNNYIGFSTVIESMADYIIKNGYVRDFEKFLNENGVSEKIKVITGPDGRKGLYFNHVNLVPLAMASSGINALMAFYYWYKHIDHLSFLFIDEFDAFYHFELAEKIVRLLENEFSIQVVLTSHNTNLLTNRIMRPDCYFILTSEKLISFANATKRELREGHNLEKLFMSGEFDG